MSDEKQKPKSEPLITSVRLVESAPFGGKEATHIEITKERRVIVARLRADGVAVAINGNEHPDGLVFERDWLDTREGNKPKSERIFQPWSNIRCVTY